MSQLTLNGVSILSDLFGWGTGAANRTRTCDPVITNDVLYQLSYCGGPNAAFGSDPRTPAPDIGTGPDWQEKRCCRLSALFAAPA